MPSVFENRGKNAFLVQAVWSRSHEAKFRTITIVQRIKIDVEP